MGRRVDVDELVGAAEIAARLGVKRLQVVHDWRRRHGEFPRPVVTVSRTLVWHWPDVQRWAVRTGRLDSDGKPSVSRLRDDGRPRADGPPRTSEGSIDEDDECWIG